MNSSTKAFLSNQLMWIGISLGISFAISMFVPFPFSLVIIIGVFMGINYYIRRRAMARMGGLGGSFLSGGYGQQTRSVNYSCLTCGQRHNSGSCPRCGSKLKRAEFSS